MTTKSKQGGKRKGAGRKSGPKGKATAKLNIKCRPDELELWKKQAELSGMWLSALVRMRMNARMPND